VTYSVGASSGAGIVVYPATTPVLDLLSVQPSAAWDLYKLKSTYAGAAVRVRRSNDNLEADIGFNASGGLDEVALMQHMVPNGNYAWDLGTTPANSGGILGIDRIMRLQNGNLLCFYAGSGPRVSTSTDNGVTWPLGTSIADNLSYNNDSVQLSNGDILCTRRTDADGVQGGIHRSIDNGVNWTSIFNFTYGGNVPGITLLANGDLLAITQGAAALSSTSKIIYRSTNNGVNWSVLANITTSGGSGGYLLALKSGAILLSNSTQIWRSTNGGATWSVVATLANFSTGRMTQLLSGRILAAPTFNAVGTKFWVSDDDGVTWNNTVDTPGLQASSAIELANGDVLCPLRPAGSKIYRSSVFTDGFATQVYDQSGNGRTLSQATAAKQPLIVVDGAIQRQNGAPTLVFDGVDDEMSATVPSLFNTAPHTINLVTTVTVAASEVGLLNYAGNANAQAITANGSTVTSYFGGAGNTVSAPLTLGKASVFTRTWDGSANLAKANLYVDQTAGATKAGTPANTSTTTTLTIGRSTTFSAQRFQGLIVFPSALGVTDRNVLELRQAEKHSVPD
jgi:hypothetical protein